jgi:hypothetical protein
MFAIETVPAIRKGWTRQMAIVMPFMRDPRIFIYSSICRFAFSNPSSLPRQFTDADSITGGLAEDHKHSFKRSLETRSVFSDN